MKENELIFDRTKHVCYSEAVKQVITDCLKKQFSKKEADILWEKIQLKYTEYLQTLPYLGGAKDNHNAPGGTYDCIALFAYYEVLDRKPSIQEIYEMNNAILLPPFRKLGKLFNINHPWQLKLLNFVFETTAKRDQKKHHSCPAGYIMQTEPFDPKTGIHYRFEQCPIAEFAKAHDLLEIMPAICNGDYPAMELLHAGQIRTTTCANGNVCDYWIVGDKSPYLKKYPKKTDEQGYFYNEYRRSIAKEKYLEETPMLNYSARNIQQLLAERDWNTLNEFERLKSIYNFVRDEILFGYNVDDSIPASKILSDGYGQCNTKGTLFMALLRACNIPCRIHGFTIDKKLQKGTMTGIVYKSAPKNIFHSWIEVYFENIWYELEAFILDSAYLNNLQKKYPDCTGSFCGYGVAVKNFQNPIIDFNRNSTYIQSEGITQDFGIYDSPDDLLKEHQQELSVLKAFIYRNLGRRLMNRNVMKLRKS